MYGIIEDHKTITIPEGVETISGRGDYSGADVIKIPASVTSIYFYKDTDYGSFDLIFVFEGRVPPKSENWYFLLCNSRVYMPKGCKEIYEKEWGEAIRKWNDSCAYEEMDHF